MFLLRRIYGLTRALLEMMKYLQYCKLYFQWKLWYKKESSSKQCVKVSHVCLVYGFLQEQKSMWLLFYHSDTSITAPMCHASVDRVRVCLLHCCIYVTFLFIGHFLWSQRQQVRLVSFPKTEPVRHGAGPSSNVCLWRSLGIRREIHVLSACSTNG